MKIERSLQKYFAIVLLFSSFMGTFHHHNDLKVHHDCQICTIQSNMANADTPVDVVYFTTLNIFVDPIVKKLGTLHSKIVTNPLKARAPPIFA